MPSVSISPAVRYSSSNDLRIDTSLSSAILTSTARKSSEPTDALAGGWPVTWGKCCANRGHHLGTPLNLWECSRYGKSIHQTRAGRTTYSGTRQKLLRAGFRLWLDEISKT